MEEWCSQLKENGEQPPVPIDEDTKASQDVLKAMKEDAERYGFVWSPAMQSAIGMNNDERIKVR